MKILITGANGFLGTAICSQATAAGHTVIAGLRKTSKTDNLKAIPDLEVVRFDYSSTEKLINSFLEIKQKFGTVDLLIHNAGLTKSIQKGAFFKVNLEITKQLTQAAKKASLLSPKGKFVYISSQAALGPAGTNGPVSEYGESKLAAEEVIKQSDLPYLIFRPTGIYGPGDMEFLSMFKSVKMGIYPCAAPPKQKMTLIHVSDVAENIIKISEDELANETIHLEDGHIYFHKDLQQVLNKLVRRKSLFLILPNFLIRTILYLGEKFGKLFGFEPIMSREKQAEITQDWDHDFSEERKKIPLTIRFNLEAGFENTYHFYKSKKLL